MKKTTTYPHSLLSQCPGAGRKTFGFRMKIIAGGWFLLSLLPAGAQTGTFTEVPAVSEGTAAWADYDNDGDLDAITIFNKNRGIWFASLWDGVRTLEQTLAGGNVRVNSGGTGSSRHYPR